MLMFKVAFSLFSNINQSVCRTLAWVLSNQSYFDRVLYMHYWEFPIQKKIFPIVICPIHCDMSSKKRIDTIISMFYTLSFNLCTIKFVLCNRVKQVTWSWKCIFRYLLEQWPHYNIGIHDPCLCDVTIFTFWP